MKNLLLIFSIFGFCFSAFAQNLEINYKVDYTEKYKDLSRIENHLARSYLRDEINAMPFVNLSLLIKEKASLFYAEKSINSDNKKMRGYSAALRHSGGRDVFYKDDSLKLVLDEFAGKKCIVLADKKKYNSWEITKEHKMILGYKCFKATMEYESYDKYMEPLWIPVEAWFTPEISVSTGPLDFDGLPGLILEVTKDNMITYFATKIESREDLTLEIPSGKNTITYQEKDSIVKKKLLEIKKRSEVYGTEF
ncbi:GLPGLI family protein [Zunongwangia sp. SCSIO 43204]|uniref:GLPGLI family protein n=1 Tax=Zunongwangia sp. SCSIO 43204 TaxID=2779359 RepID=UPI001CAA31D6|nr:GLPGLI family protein [Zunongwangia sp. SCSIO 43204]UAB85385.1 GLPGLI family protein [Zunongwangia sp. SCSIO 43204]